MNANELADELEVIFTTYSDESTFDQAATMLRQQQAEYYSLLVNHDKLYAKVIEQQAEIEALKGDGKVCARCGAIAYDPVITQTAKTLTDEEIYKIANSIEIIQPQHGLRLSNDLNVMDFAKAILRKAQEK